MFSITDKHFLTHTSLDSIIFDKGFNFKLHLSRLDSTIEYFEISSKSQSFTTNILINRSDSEFSLRGFMFQKRRIVNV